MNTLNRVLIVSLICVLGVLIYIINGDVNYITGDGFATKIPDEYIPACDRYFGKEQWKTINMDWIDYYPGFVRENPNLFYPLKDKNGNLHDYGCVINGTI